MASSYGGNCVSYARAVTGMDISGNAGAWWGNAAGRYSRGHTPAAGSVLVFRPSGAMWLGHVAVVAHVVNKREILVDQANWVPGRVVKDMAVYDVSAANNWSAVRVADYRAPAWGRINPTFGFIYPDRRAPELIEADYQPDQPASHASATRSADRERLAPRAAAGHEAARDRTRSAEAARHERAATRQARLHDERAATEKKLAALHARKVEEQHHAERLASAERKQAGESHESAAAPRREAVERADHHEPVRLAQPAQDKRVAERDRHAELHNSAVDRRHGHPAVHTAARTEHPRTEHPHPAERHIAKAGHPAVRPVRHVAARRVAERRPEQIAEARPGAN